MDVNVHKISGIEVGDAGSNSGGPADARAQLRPSGEEAQPQGTGGHILAHAYSQGEEERETRGIRNACDGCGCVEYFTEARETVCLSKCIAPGQVFFAMSLRHNLAVREGRWKRPSGHSMPRAYS